MLKIEDITPDMIKTFALHLKVLGAYVQAPNPAIVALSDNEVVASNDASALYPTTIIHQNIGFDTLRHRVYDPGTIQNVINLLQQVFESKKNNPAIIDQAISGFQNALDQTLKDFFKRKTVTKKNEMREFVLVYYMHLLRKILEYPGSLEDIFKPINDKTYILLKSYFFPFIEMISWISPQNRGYNKTIVEYIFFHEDFMKKPRKFYVFKNINSTKSTFEIISFDDGIKLFQNYIINPYGTLFDKHDDNLSFDVELLIEALGKRRVIKNQMLVLGAIQAQWSKVEGVLERYFSQNNLTIDEKTANKILDLIHDKENRDKRLSSLTSIEFNIPKNMNLKDYIRLRISQLNVIQLGIKVTANSLYGIYGLITWIYANPLIGNSITNAGKIFGTKLFQSVSVNYFNNIIPQKKKQYIYKGQKND